MPFHITAISVKHVRMGRTTAEKERSSREAKADFVF